MREIAAAEDCRRPDDEPPAKLIPSSCSRAPGTYRVRSSALPVVMALEMNSWDRFARLLGTYMPGRNPGTTASLEFPSRLRFVALLEFPQQHIAYMYICRVYARVYGEAYTCTSSVSYHLSNRDVIASSLY